MKEGRVRVLDWFSRKNPRELPTITVSVTRLVDLLDCRNFVPVRKSSNNLYVSPNELLFERHENPDIVSYVGVTFSSDGDLGFAAHFGVRHTSPPHRWKRAGNFVRITRLGFRTPNLGGGWFTRSKARHFRRDWNLLLSQIDNVVAYLDGGSPGKNIAESEIRDTVVPRQNREDTSL